MNTTNPFIFHLVLSPIDSTSHNVTSHPDGLHQPIGLPALPTDNLNARGLNIPPRPASTSQVPDGGQQAFPQHQNIPFNPLLNMIPPGLQLGPGVDIRMQFTQTGRPFQPPHTPPGMNMQGAQMPTPIVGPGFTPPWIQDPQLLMTQQQMQQMHHQIHQEMVNRGHNHIPSGMENGNHSQHASRSHSQESGSIRRSSDIQPHVHQNRPPQAHSPTPTVDRLAQNRQSPSIRQFPNGGLPALSSMAAANLHAIRQNHLQNMQLDQMSQFTQLRNALINPLQTSRPSMSLFSSTQTVFLMSSPRGPEALLLSPSGTFTTNVPSHSPSLNPGWGSIVHNNQNNHPNTPHPDHIQPAVQQQPEQQQDQVGDILRILLPMGGHLWLLVRLVGVVYIFSGGRDWSNTILLGIIAFIGFLAQTGLFNPLVRNVWQPIREHVEGIINLEHPRPRPADPQRQTPEQMADRLLRRQGNENLVRRIVRRAERSIILFAASLIPGVGEGQVRARERAEREQREADEAAEQARNEAEQLLRNEELQKTEEKQPEAIIEIADVDDNPSNRIHREETGVD